MISLQLRGLNQRLWLALTLASLAYTAGVGWLTVRDSVDEVYELFDVHLAQTGLALLRVTDPDEDDAASIPGPSKAPQLQQVFNEWPELPERLARLKGRSGARSQGVPAIKEVAVTRAIYSQYERNLRYQVLDGSGLLILRSANAPESMMTARDGFSESSDPHGQVWRHFSVWDRHGDFRVVVSEDYDLRNRLIRNIALHLASPVAIGLPVLLVLFWLSIQRGLQPLNSLATEIDGRKPDSLVGLDESQSPTEVRPIISALNKLMRQMADSLEGERRFTANAAHELKTPLASIQTQVFLVRNAASDSDRQHALDQLQRGVERASRLVSQLLAMARLDADQPLQDPVPLDVGEVVQEMCAELAPKAFQRGHTLELDADLAVPVALGNADLIAMLVSNLVDNAIRYSPRQSAIHVKVFRRDGDPVIQVTDDGPGIPEEQRNRVFERFFRLAQSDQSGTGLGLSICHRIAQLHGADLDLTGGREGKGTTVEVIFRAASQPNGSAASAA